MSGSIRTGRRLLFPHRLKPSPLFILVLLGLCILSCGREESENEQGESDAVSGGGRPASLVVAVAEEPDQLVPPFSRSPSSAAIWPWILPSLVRVVGDSIGCGRVVGDIAVSWECDEGGKLWRFILETGRFWEDTSAVGVADVVLTYRMYRDPLVGGPWAERLSEIASVEASSDGRTEVFFRFHKPTARMRALQMASLPLISSRQWEKTKDRRPLLGEPGRVVHAAGPFRIEEWRRGESIRLARHPFPPHDRVPRAERILLRLVPSGRGRMVALAQGAVDCAMDLPLDEITQLHEEAPGIRVEPAGESSIEALAWNLDHPVWGGTSPRREVGERLDRSCLRRTAASPALDFTSTDSAAAVESVPPDTATGPTAIGPSTLDLIYSSVDPWRERVAIKIALELDRLGVACRLHPLSPQEWLQRLDNRLFEAALVGWRGPLLPDVGDLWGSHGMYNVAGLSDASTDSLIALARSAAADTIPDVWARVESRGRSRHAYLFIARRMRFDGLGPDVEGYGPAPLEPYGNLLTLEKRGREPGRERFRGSP